MFQKKEFLAGGLTMAQIHDRSQKAVLLAGAVMLASYPMFLYEYQHLTTGFFPRIPSRQWVQLVSLGNAIILFFAALLSALVGFLYADRLSLPGFGKWRDLARWFPVGISAGLFFTPLMYFTVDRELLRHQPALFPRPWTWALLWPLGSALAQETVGRFGLLTIGVYLLRWRRCTGYPWPAILLVSLFAVVSAILFQLRLRLNLGLSPSLLITVFLLSFLFNWFYAEVYLRRGLLSVLAFHYGLSVKLLLYALLLNP